MGDKAIKDPNNGSVTITRNVASVTVAELGKSHASDNNGNNINIDGTISGTGNLVVDGNVAKSGRRVAFAKTANPTGDVRAEGEAVQFNGGIGANAGTLAIAMKSGCTCQLSAPNSYTGNTVVASGNLRLNSADTIPQATAALQAAGARNGRLVYLPNGTKGSKSSTKAEPSGHSASSPRATPPA